MNTKTLIVTVFLLIAVPGFAAAKEPGAGDTTTPGKRDRGAVVIGVKAGALFAQPFTTSRLGTSFLVDVEVGYALPVWKRGIVLLLDVGYTQPVNQGDQTDPRVTSNGGSYNYQLIQRELLLGFTAFYRFSWIGSGRVAPYLGIGPRLWLLQSRANGAAGQNNNIDLSREQSTRIGLTVPVGVDFGVGPGRLFVEGALLWSPVNHRITGQSNVGSVTVQGGYRFWF